MCLLTGDPAGAITPAAARGRGRLANRTTFPARGYLVRRGKMMGIATALALAEGERDAQAGQLRRVIRH
jgi:hypothetical protein